MRTYKADLLHWITVKFKGNACGRCKRPVNAGARVFYYPEDRSLYCDSEDCGKAASRKFSERAFEKDNTWM